VGEPKILATVVGSAAVFFSALGVVGIDAKPARQNVQERDLAARPGWHGWDHWIWPAR